MDILTAPPIRQWDEQYVMHTYGRAPVVLIRGEGVRVWDGEGREYLDFLAGIAVNSLGHCHPRVVEAVRDQAGRLIHCSNLYYSVPQAKLASLLGRISGGYKAFFANSGAEANEGAIKLARKYARAGGNNGERFEIVSALNSFHGRTMACLAATGQAKYGVAFAPLPPGFRHVAFNDLAAAEAAIGPATCAVLVEPVQGEGGIVPADRAYLEGLRRLCDERGALLIFDEIQCGIARTGRMFAWEHYGVRPDIITLAKGLGGGLPIGAVLARPEVAAAFAPGDHGSTFGGNPVACAAAAAVLETVLGEDLAGRAARVGDHFRRRLLELAARYPFIVEVRGLGLMLGIQLSFPGRALVDRCREEGLLINCTNDVVLRFLPPLVVEEADVDRAAEILERVLATAAAGNDCSGGA